MRWRHSSPPAQLYAHHLNCVCCASRNVSSHHQSPSPRHDPRLPSTDQQHTILITISFSAIVALRHTSSDKDVGTMHSIPALFRSHSSNALFHYHGAHCPGLCRQTNGLYQRVKVRKYINSLCVCQCRELHTLTTPEHIKAALRLVTRIHIFENTIPKQKESPTRCLSCLKTSPLRI